MSRIDPEQLKARLIAKPMLTQSPGAFKFTRPTPVQRKKVIFSFLWKPAVGRDQWYSFDTFELLAAARPLALYDTLGFRSAANIHEYLDESVYTIISNQLES